MLICYGECESFEKQQQRAYKQAVQKLKRKVASIKMLINDAKISEKQRNELKYLYKNLL